MKLAFALVAAVAGVTFRGASVTYDTRIAKGSPSTNFNTETDGLWDGPFSGAISSVTSDTSALLIKFDLSSLVGATLVPTSRAWLHYKNAGNTGDPANLRELTVPWDHVCTSPSSHHMWHPG